MSGALDIGFHLAGQPRARGGTIEATMLASIDLDVPGLRIAVEKASVTVVLGLDMHPQNGLHLVPQLLTTPPRGAAAELSLPGFSGGGHLEITPTEWRGAVAARLGPVNVTGFAVLNPDPFSLLVLLAAEFTPPVQMSFGFTLVGVGGLVGINRRADREALGQAVTSGELSKLLFPRDPVAQAPTLLATLSRCFPQHEGAFVIGPFLKLGWGTPSLLTATLGLIMAENATIIVGRIALTLPFEEVDLIHLEATVLGVIDAQGIAIDASLANSSLVGIPVDGDIKLRIRGGSDPLFALSAGGFHPAFPVPDGMGDMRRIGAEISPGPILRARLEAYVAVTTNSVQMGARAQLTAGVGGFGIEGDFAFDALVLFDPFGFQVDLHARVSVECADFSVCSIRFDGALSGPSPWRIKGSASFSVLWWDIDADLPEIVWGHPKPGPLPPARDPLGVLAAEMRHTRNWTASSTGVPSLVQLRPTGDRGRALVHPLAQLGFMQSAVPMATRLDRMDGAALEAPTTLTVQFLGSAGQELTAALKPGSFVASQFLSLDTAAQLSSAGYAQLPAGVDVRPDGTTETPARTEREETYELFVLDREGVLAHDLIASLPDLVLTPQIVVPQREIDRRTSFLTVLDPARTVAADANELRELGGQASQTQLTTVASQAAASGDNALAAAADALRTVDVHEFSAIASSLISGPDIRLLHAWEAR